ncbi:F-box/FBD/LRR-repeat protein At1g13570 [Rosa chinensis]|uniref:F-box/FBD/LRR-repeat protein At1g13570 n=1 Tax=Rosa chinensis TaxID=74649 RepID=UPI000D086EA7|nr:F-box/FBD/LRR-repeat protein At1g13570 [Rosa chinensis]
MCQKAGKTANSASKKKRDELDKISNLPSGVTQQILSFLPIREAVRTSILSSNWRHKWAMVRHLVFDDQCVSDMMKGGTKRTKTFENIVDHVLLLHSGSIDTFKLSSRIYLIESSYLTHLELYNCLLKPPVMFKGFPRLKSLEIQKVTVAQDVLEKVIICCPLLERMTLCDLRNITHLNIDAPNLQFLNVGGGFQSFKLKNTPNLVGMKVTGFRGLKAEVDFLRVQLLSSPLQELEISFGQEKNMMRLDDNRNCTSTQLRVLKITGFVVVPKMK